MTTLFIDTETYSPVDIKEGTARYFEGGGQPTIIAFAVDDGEVQTVTCRPRGGWDVRELGRVQELMTNATTVVAHNVTFDRRALAALGMHIPLEKWHCTMAQAAMHGLPGALGDLCGVFKLPTDMAKLTTGKTLMKLFCMPQKNGERLFPQDRPAEWSQFVAYAKSDIRAMRELYKKLPRSNLPVELRVWRADQQINERGLPIDVPLARAMTAWLENDAVAQRSRTKARTAGAVESATQGAALLKYLLDEHGVALPDMRESTIERRMKDEELPVEVRELLADRLTSAKATGAKYQAALNAVSKDGRVRNTLQYCGARRTGRWAGRTVQPQNFARPSWKAEEIDSACQSISQGFYPAYPAAVAAKECVRGLIVAPPGKTLGVVDYSQIEARVLPWLAGDSEAMTAFSEYDAGRGSDIYRRTYAGMFGVTAESVTKDQRQQAKIFALACQFGGGVGAMLTGCAAYGTPPGVVAQHALRFADLELTGAAARSIQFAKGQAADLDRETYIGLWCATRLWRRANAKVENLWRQLEVAVAVATRTGDRMPAGRLSVDRPHPAWLRIRLPSGRYLMYCQPQIDEQGRFTYAGINPYTRKWGRCDTYGGRLAENVTQAAARDVMAHAIADITEGGGEIVLTVHDELVQELSGEWTLQRMEHEMTKAREWTAGLSLAAEGFETTRYRK